MTEIVQAEVHLRSARLDLADRPRVGALLVECSQRGCLIGRCHHGNHADADVEHPAQLVLFDALVDEPLHHAWSRPGRRVDDHAAAVGDDPRRVAFDATAGDVRKRMHVDGGAQRTDVIDINLGWRE